MKRLLPVFIISCLLILCNLQHSNLYAQDPELFEHTWYLEKVNIQGDEYNLANYYTAEPSITEFDEQNASMYSSLCEFVCFWTSTSFDSGENVMNLSEYDECALTGECTASSSELYFYKDIYFSIFYFWDSTTQEGVFNNPFTYSIEPIDDYYQLTIENGEGDWAVYNSVYLSINDFSKDNFTLYPNPVKENLNVNNNSNQQVTAIIYDLNGKLLQSHAIENEITVLNVKNLN